MDNGSDSYRRFLDGDKDALVEIITEYRDGLTFFINGFTKNLTEAEELAQETFIKLYVKKPKFKRGSSFKTWLYKIGRNMAIDYLRRNRRTVTVPINNAEEFADISLNPEYRYLNKQKQARLHSAMCGLKPEYYQILWLIYFEGMSNKEVSRVLDKSENNIAVILYRAKAALKSELMKEGIDYENI